MASSPTPRPYIRPDEQDELDARRPVHAGILPSNKSWGTSASFSWGGSASVSEEESMRGWTAQQPFSHVDCDVMHLCIYCAVYLDPNRLRQHECAVRRELEHAR
jgi:hypothetical protein